MKAARTPRDIASMGRQRLFLESRNKIGKFADGKFTESMCWQWAE